MKHPKDKAKELVEKMHSQQEGYYLDNINNAKQCAIISVDMVIQQFIGVYDSLKFAAELTGNVEDTANYKYWQEVKREINNL